MKILKSSCGTLALHCFCSIELTGIPPFIAIAIIFSLKDLGLNQFPPCPRFTLFLKMIVVLENNYILS